MRHRFTLPMVTKTDVEQAHREFTTTGKDIGITEVGKLESTNGTANFTLRQIEEKKARSLKQIGPSKMQLMCEFCRDGLVKLQ